MLYDCAREVRERGHLFLRKSVFSPFLVILTEKGKSPFDQFAYKLDIFLHVLINVLLTRTQKKQCIVHKQK